MATKVSICNMALSHVGVAKEIANVDTEKSDEARACRRFYEEARQAVLRDFAWPFATKIAALALIEEEPNDEWTYSYDYPADCLFFRRVLSGNRNDSRQTRVSTKIAHGDNGLIVYTDQEDAEAEYTVNADDPGLYPPDFSLALSWLLASLIAPRMAEDDTGLGRRAAQMYEVYISRAQANAANEEQPDEPPESELIDARG